MAMKCLLAQFNPTVGDLEGNVRRIQECYLAGVELGVDLVICPELAVTGYPPRDLLLKPHFVDRNLALLEDLAKQTGSVGLVIGFVARNVSGVGRPLHNAVALLHEGAIKATRFKTLLPTYDVFEEDRYFEPSSENTPVAFKGHKLGLTICEDAWNHPLAGQDVLYGRRPLETLKQQGATHLINIAASPWQLGKAHTRQRLLKAQSAETGLPLIYCNMVGGNDELLFDGGSLWVHPTEGIMQVGPFFETGHLLVDLNESKRKAEIPQIELDEAEQLYKALSVGVRDYVHKCGFDSVLLGLSGGIDSAVTAAIAVEALGSDKVRGVALPSAYSSEGSVLDAADLADRLGIKLDRIPIEPTFQSLSQQLKPIFAGMAEDVTEENMQARIRGAMLMAMSNKLGALLLTTGNKSELAVGYCTLYGDMCGGLAVLSDCPKTMVYRLARWINRHEEVIPWATIDKPPSAELRPDQKDQDSLPEYEVLDAILQSYLVEHASIETLVSQGYDRPLVERLTRLMDLNEYKRRQAAPGLKVTSRAFGMGRRMPIAQRYRA